jgi:hypothetical protein
MKWTGPPVSAEDRPVRLAKRSGGKCTTPKAPEPPLTLLLHRLLVQHPGPEPVRHVGRPILVLLAVRRAVPPRGPRAVPLEPSRRAPERARPGEGRHPIQPLQQPAPRGAHAGGARHVRRPPVQLQGALEVARRGWGVTLRLFGGTFCSSEVATVSMVLLGVKLAFSFYRGHLVAVGAISNLFPWSEGEK